MRKSCGVRQTLRVISGSEAVRLHAAEPAYNLTPNGDEIVLGDVIVSDGVVQYDLGRRLPESFVRKDTLLDSLGGPDAEIRAVSEAEGPSRSEGVAK